MNSDNIVKVLAIHKAATHDNLTKDKKEGILNYIQMVRKQFEEEKKRIEVVKQKKKVDSVEDLEEKYKSSLDDFVEKTEILYQSQKLVDALDKKDREELKRSGFLLKQGKNSLKLDNPLKNKGYAFVSFATTVQF